MTAQDCGYTRTNAGLGNVGGSRSRISPIPGPGVTRDARSAANELRVYGHSKLFYWWPIWMLSFLFALLTWWDGHRLAILPPTAPLCSPA